MDDDDNRSLSVRTQEPNTFSFASVRASLFLLFPSSFFLLSEYDNKDDDRDNDKSDEEDNDDEDDDKDNLFLSFFLSLSPVHLSSDPLSREDDDDDKLALPIKNDLFPPLFPCLPHSRTKTEPAMNRTQK
jgi:hypothetical protein